MEAAGREIIKSTINKDKGEVILITEMDLVFLWTTFVKSPDRHLFGHLCRDVFTANGDNLQTGVSFMILFVSLITVVGIIRIIVI